MLKWQNCRTNIHVFGKQTSVFWSVLWLHVWGWNPLSTLCAVCFEVTHDQALNIKLKFYTLYKCTIKASVLKSLVFSYIDLRHVSWCIVKHFILETLNLCTAYQNDFCILFNDFFCILCTTKYPEILHTKRFCNPPECVMWWWGI